jgi:hypothetical protein
MKKFGMLCALLAGALLAAQAQAQQPGQTYFGVGVGSVWTDGASPYTVNVRDEDTSAGLKLYGGKMWGKFGMELGFYHLGEYDVIWTGNGLPFAESKAAAIAVSGVYATPVGAGYSFHAKLGLAFTQFETTCLDAAVCAASNPVLVNTKKRGMSGLIGVGMGAQFSQNVAARVDYEHFGSVHQAVSATREYKDAYDMLSVSLQFSF